MSPCRSNRVVPLSACITAVVFCVSTDATIYEFPPPVDPAQQEFTVGLTAWDPGPNTSRTSTGNPAPGGATWSVMPGGLGGTGFTFNLNSTHGFFLTLPLESLNPGLVGMELAAIDDALDIWDAASGFTNLGMVADGGVAGGASESQGGHLGDIRVAAWEIDDSVSPNELAHAYLPGTELLPFLGQTILGDAHFDVIRNWIDDPNDIVGNGNFYFSTIALHELGHSLGLQHSTVVGSVMEAGLRRWPPRAAPGRHHRDPGDLRAARPRAVNGVADSVRRRGAASASPWRQAIGGTGELTGSQD